MSLLATYSKLSKKIHPLLITRGVPGTHDIVALKNDVIDFQKNNFPIITPTFNKLKDDISIKKKIIKNLWIISNILLRTGSPLSWKFILYEACLYRPLSSKRNDN